MSLTGLFLILFLVIHLIGNLQLISDDEGQAFNVYSDFMSHNTLIQLISKGNFFFIVVHAIQGIVLYFTNKKAKGLKYAVSPKNGTSWASRNMALLGILILAFLLMHLGHFWFQFKFGSETPMISYSDEEIVNAYESVSYVFANPLWVALYMVGLIALAFHLWHGFQSAFQSLGLNHKKYTPLIKLVGRVYAILIPLGFAFIPLYMYFK